MYFNQLLREWDNTHASESNCRIDGDNTGRNDVDSWLIAGAIGYRMKRTECYSTPTSGRMDLTTRDVAGAFTRGVVWRETAYTRCMGVWCVLLYNEHIVL